MAPSPRAPYSVGSPSFDPDVLFTQWSTNPTLPNGNDFRSSILATFSLPLTDNYVYHAIASVNLSQVQQAINAGSSNNLHAWYRSSTNEPVCSPSLSLVPFLYVHESAL